MDKLFYEVRAPKANLLVRPSTTLPCFSEAYGTVMIRLVVTDEFGARDTCPPDGQFVYSYGKWHHFVGKDEIGNHKFVSSFRGVAEAVTELCNSDSLNCEAELEIGWQEWECPSWPKSRSWQQNILVAFRITSQRIERSEEFTRVLMRRFAKAISRHADDN